jgi:hypothetical protein
VADIDLRHNPPRELLELLPPTVRVDTPSGGYHLHYDSGGKRYDNSKLAQGVDIRCASGYALLPPSVLDEREIARNPNSTTGIYTWKNGRAWAARFPSWAEEQLLKRKVARTGLREAQIPIPESQLVEILSYLDPSCDITTWIGRLGSILATPLEGVDEAEMDERLFEIADAWWNELWGPGRRGAPLGYAGAG